MSARARNKQIITPAYRREVALRALLASVGGFALVSFSGSFFAVILANNELMTMPHAVHSLTLLGFVAWACIAMWAFAAGNVQRLSWKIIGTSVLFAMLYWWTR